MKRKRIVSAAAAAVLSAVLAFSSGTAVFAHASLEDDGTYFYGVDYNEVTDYTFRNFENMIIAMMMTHCHYGDAGSVSYYDWIWTSEAKMTDWELADIITHYMYRAEYDTYETTYTNGGLSIGVDHMHKMLRNTLGWSPYAAVSEGRLSNDGIYYTVPAADGEGTIYQLEYQYGSFDSGSQYCVRYRLTRYFEFTGETEVSATADAYFEPDYGSDFGWRIVSLVMR